MKQRNNVLRRMFVGVLSTALVVSTLTSSPTTSNAAAKPKLKTKSLNVLVGQKKSIKIKKKGSAKVTYKAKGKAIKVSAKGAVTGKKVGTAKVVCKVKQGKKYTFTCNVKVVKLSLKANQTSMNVGSSQTLKYSFKSPVKKDKLKFTSSKASVATVSSKGVVSAKAAGIATITAKATKTGVSKSVKIKVNASTVSKTNYVVSAISAINTKLQFTVTLTPPTGSSIQASRLKGTSISLANGSIKVTAQFTSVSGNKAVYTVKAADQAKLKPRNRTANGTYTLSSAYIVFSSVKTTTYYETLSGSFVEGFVYDDDTKLTVAGAKVTLDNGTSTKTDKNGHYIIASSVGNETVTTSANGYFDDETSLKVGLNRFSSCNVALETYQREQIFINGYVSNSETEDKLSGVIVSLYENNILKARVTTSSDGGYVFANSQAYTSDVSGSKVFFRYGQGLDKGNSYKIVCEKPVSQNNLFGAFEAKTKNVNLSGKQTVASMAIRPIAGVASIRFAAGWTEKAASNVTATVGKKIDFTVQLMNTNGYETLVAPKTITVDVIENRMMDTYNLVKEKYFSSNAQDKPTLPTGTYFLVIRDGINATSVIPVSITEGEDATKTMANSIDEGFNFTVNSTITKAVYNNLSYANQNNGSNLYAVTDNEGTLGSNSVNVGYNVTTSVSGVDVLVDTISNIPFTYELKDGASSATAKSSLPLLKKDTSYKATSFNRFINGGVVNIAVGAGDTTTKTMEYEARADVSRIRLNGLDQLDVASSTELYIKSIKLTGPKTYTYYANNMDDCVVTASEFVNSGFSIPEGALDSVEPGDYNVTIDIDGFQPMTTEKQIKIISYQDATLKITDPFSQIVEPEVKGSIKFADGLAEGESVDAATLLLVNSAGRIVAATDYRKSDSTYSLKNGVNGTFAAGTYKLIARGQGFETYTQSVTIKPNSFATAPILVNEGGNGSLQMGICDSSEMPLMNTDYGLSYLETYVSATDSKYINIDNGYENITVLAKNALSSSSYLGEFELQRGDSIMWEVKDCLPADVYHVTAFSYRTGFNFINETVAKGKATQETRWKLPIVNTAALKQVTLTFTGARISYPYSFGTVEDSHGNLLYLDADVDRNNEVTFWVPENVKYNFKVLANDYYSSERSASLQSYESTSLAMPMDLQN